MTIAEFEKIGKKEGFILYSFRVSRHDNYRNRNRYKYVEIRPRGLQLVDTREPRARHLLSKRRFEFRFESMCIDLDLHLDRNVNRKSEGGKEIMVLRPTEERDNEERRRKEKWILEGERRCSDETGAKTPSPRRSAAGVKEKSPRMRIVLFPAARRIVYKKRRSNKHEKKTRESYGAATTHVDSFKIGWWWSERYICCRYRRNGTREGGAARRGGRARRRRRPSVSSLTLFSPRRRLGKYAVNSVAIRTGFDHHQTCFAF